MKQLNKIIIKGMCRKGQHSNIIYTKSFETVIEKMSDHIGDIILEKVQNQIDSSIKIV